MAKPAKTLETATATPTVLPDLTKDQNGKPVGPANGPALTIGQYVLDKNGEPKKNKRGKLIPIVHDIPVHKLPAPIQAKLERRKTLVAELKKLDIETESDIENVWRNTAAVAWKLPDGYESQFSRQWGRFTTAYVPKGEGSASVNRTADDATDWDF
jgi:hypothetical protein